MQTFKIKKKQSIIDDVPGDIIYELTITNPDCEYFGTKYISRTKYVSLTPKELIALTDLLIITGSK